MIATAMIAALMLIGLALWWHLRVKQQDSINAQLREEADRATRYRCVELSYSSDACDAVKKLGAVRFLPDAAPRIPLQGCGIARCFCRYVHHEDRREDDRRNPFGLQASEPPPSVGRDRRLIKERRKPYANPFQPQIQR